MMKTSWWRHVYAIYAIILHAVWYKNYSFLSLQCSVDSVCVTVQKKKVETSIKWKANIFVFTECSSRLTLEPSISSLMVHIGSNVKLDCIGGPAASGNRNSFLKWELANKQPFHNNVKTFHLADRHRRYIICDVERLSITNFTKDNKGNYHCARKHNTTLVSINMIGKSISSFYAYKVFCWHILNNILADIFKYMQ